MSLNFNHKNNKGLKHSDEEETQKERTKTKEKGRERKTQEEKEEEKRRKVSRGRELKSKTTIPQRTNVYNPCTAEVNQRESN